MRRAKQLNDSQLVEKWFIEYGDDIYSYLVYYTGSTEVEDIVQEVFIKALKGIKNFKGESAPKTWLFSIARNAATDYYRKLRPLRLTPYETLDNLPSDGMTADEKIGMDEDIKDVYMAMKSLKKSYRDVLLLREVKELTPSETAQILNWTESRVNSTLHRAVKALKKILYEGKEGKGYEGIQ